MMTLLYGAMAISIIALVIVMNKIEDKEMKEAEETL